MESKGFQEVWLEEGVAFLPVVHSHLAVDLAINVYAPCAAIGATVEESEAKQVDMSAIISWKAVMV